MFIPRRLPLPQRGAVPPPTRPCSLNSKERDLLSQHTITPRGGIRTTASTGDCLPVPLILNITSGEYTLDIRECRTGDRDDITIRVRVDLTADQACCGFMSNSIEESVDGEVGNLTSLGVLGSKGV